MSNQERIIHYRNLIIKELAPLINKDYVLLDIPNHANIGDNLIWEGELQFLKKISHRCIYSANLYNWEEDKIKDAKIILFHGGGNWGDLYRECQEHRLEIAERFKDKRIIVFPQTVWYKNEDLLPFDCKIFNEHPDIYICVRDQQSKDLLLRYIAKEKIILLPDMAFFIDIPPISTKPNKTDTLFMLRTDAEIEKIALQIDSNFETKDWPTFSNKKYVLFFHAYWTYCKIKLSKYMQRSRVLRKFVSPIYGLNNKNNRERYIERGIKFFSKYETIYTTRLHGLILGILMNKNMIIVDNKYNKCKNFYDTWLRDFDNITIFK